MILNPELQFSGNNEVATVKLDIFGEVVVTLGTVPQGQGHETTSAQVVADILGCTPDDVNVRAGHDTYWNSTRRLLRDVRVAVRRHGARRRQGRHRQARRRDEAARRGRLRLRARRHRARREPGADQGQPRSRAAVHGARRDPQREQRRAAARPRRHAQRPVRLQAAVREAGPRAQVRQPHAHLRDADPCVRARDRPGDRGLRDRRLRGGGRLRQPHPSPDRRGTGARRHRTGARRRNARDLHLRRGGQPAHAQLLRLPRAARTRHAADEDRLHRVDVAVHAARREGHGRRRRRRDPRRLRGLAERARQKGEGPIVWRSCNPYEGVWDLLRKPEETRKLVSVETR